MAIYAEAKGGGDYAPMDSGLFIARCVQMLQLGSLTEEINGETKTLHKVRLGFEFPQEKKVFKEEDGERPYFLSKEYTLNFHEKATLRLHLESWRSKKFTEDEAKRFDITKLLGVPCMINVVHKVAKSNGKTYAEIGSISPVMKGLECPPQINPTQELNYDNFDFDLFNSLPEFLRKKIESTPEYQALGKTEPSTATPPAQSGEESETPTF